MSYLISSFCLFVYCPQLIRYWNHQSSSLINQMDFCIITQDYDTNCPFPCFYKKIIFTIWSDNLVIRKGITIIFWEVHRSSSSSIDQIDIGIITQDYGTDQRPASCCPIGIGSSHIRLPVASLSLPMSFVTTCVCIWICIFVCICYCNCICICICNSFHCNSFQQSNIWFVRL